MLIQLQDNIPAQLLESIFEELKTHGLKPSLVETRQAKYLICNGKKEYDIRQFGNLPGVKDIHIVEDPNKLVSRQWRVQDTEIRFDDGTKISRDDLTIVMGPCSVENEEQVIKTVEFLKENNIRFMRGGIFKPRSSPYSFRGLGIDGLKFFSAHCRANSIKVVSEVMQVSQIEPMYDYVDVFQVGTRNSQNYNLLDELGKADKPVLLKRGMSGTLQEFLASAEYIFSNGNEKIILCERGIRTFEKAYRNTMDLNAIPYLRDKSHLPVFSDPSHGVGIRNYVEPIALASVMAGADGVLIEIHECPPKAFSDGDQTLDFYQARRAVQRLRETMELRKKLVVD
ncbi:MAG: 3-deoxy-7-phosphoheptulonate synthase [Bacteroidetes bacterium]|nr:MAG: 3-deoxy-7-phosphoheptulonate synthase [Bacteroidota bacterium]